MNLKRIIRAVVCAAIIALPVIGAGVFPARPVAGHESSPGSLQGAAAIERLKQDGQYEALQAALNQARFNVSRAEQTPLRRAAWHAPNPAAGYDAYVTETGVSIALNEQSYVSLSLQGLGYGAMLRAVGPGEVSGDKQTISLMRDGGVREWYINGPEGLEQGFTLLEPPGVPQAGVPLRLALQVSEGWRAVASEDGQRVTLRSKDGQVVQYSKLVVRDGFDRQIAARLAVAEQQVVIEVQDSEATYPLTIDPVFSFQQKLVAPDGAAHDNFGVAVALSGDTAVIGASLDDFGVPDLGSVYVFVRNGAAWTFQQKLTAYDGWAFDEFGKAVAIDGNTLVVGAPSDNSTTQVDVGSAYVFTRSGGFWSFQQKLTAFDGSESDGFCGKIALSGNTLVVSADVDDVGAQTDQGSAYVFTLNGAFWSFQQKLTALDGAAGDHFGSALALSGNTLAVGAFWDNVGAHLKQGSVYVFTRNGTAWTEQQRFSASDGAAGDQFGSAIALSGYNMVVGASGDTIGGEPFQGSAYLFSFNGAAWAEQQKFTASDGAWYEYFGSAVALSGYNLMVGASGNTVGSNGAQGAVYVFNAPCPSLTLVPANLPTGFIGALYQQSVTVSGGQGPYQFTLSGGALPPGLSLSASGLISGPPTTLGTYQFTISATDLSSLCSASRTYTVTITTCSTITLNPPPPPNGTVGMPYSHTLTASGGTAPYTFVIQPAPPPGLSLSPGGVFSGTPTQVGTFSFRLVIRDANGCAAAWSSSITIVKPNIDPCAAITLDPLPLPDGMVDKEYVVQLTPSGGREPYTFGMQGALPPGLSLTPEGYLIGTPTEDGSFYFRLTVRDDQGCSRTFECPIMILKAE